MSTTNQPIRRSIEVEYWVIDDAGRLVEPGDLIDATPGAEREFVKPMLEIKTTPCETTRELRTELFDRLQAVISHAAECGKGLVPLATPLHHDEIEEIPCDRTRVQNEVVGEEFAYVRHCAGTHIHFEQQSEKAVDQLNTLIALDPALALVNSARHHRGEPMAAGARSKCYRRLAYDSLPHQGTLWPYVTDREEWNQRLQARYEEFRDRALETGISEAVFDDCFTPESAVWTPVQLREEFNTVEWRSPDTGLPSQMVQLADELADVIATVRDCPVRIDNGQRGSAAGRVGETEIVLPSFETVCEVVDRAIADGLTPSVQAYLSQMGFEPTAYEPVAEQFSDETLTAADAREYRLAYADRLRDDVRNASLVAAD